MTALIRRRAAAGTGSQAGLTLMELLLALVISMLVVTPVTAWGVLVLNQHDDSQNALDRVNATGLVNQYLPRDVASAKYVQAGGSQCTGVTTTNTTKLQLVPADATRRILYSEGTATNPGGAVTVSLWRRVCDDAGNLKQSTELVRGIRAGSLSINCIGPSGPVAPAGCDNTPSPANPASAANDANRQIDVSVVPLDAKGQDARAIEVRLSRRTSSQSTGAPSTSNRSPVPSISVSPASGFASTTFVLSGAGSFDPDGTIASYTWTFPFGTTCTPSDGGRTQSCRFAGIGSKLVQLAVTDDGGATSATATTLLLLNQFPMAEASVNPTSGTAGTTAFTFTATSPGGVATSDPDGDALTYQWDFGEDMGAARYQSSPSATFTFPATTPTSVRQVTLLVTDSHGDNDFAVVLVNVTGVGGPIGGGPGDGDPSGITVDPGLVTTGTGLPRLPDAVGAGLPSQTATFSSADPAPDPATVTWQLLRHGTTTVVANGSGASLVHTFGPAEGGDYDIVRTVAGVPASRSFRVNTAPIASFTATPGSGTAPLDIRFDASGSSDAEGSALSYRWDLGFFGQWSSSDVAPVRSFPNAGTYKVTLFVTDSDGTVAATTRVVTLGGTTVPPGGVRWDGWNIAWNAVPGATSYDVRVNYICDDLPANSRNNSYPVDPVLAPSVSTPSVATVCAGAGSASVVVGTIANAVTSPLSAPVTKFG